MEDDLSKQVDEIEALNSIYGAEWKVEDEANRSYCICIKECGHTLTLYVTLPTDYPSVSLPKYHLCAPGIKLQEKQQIVSALDELGLLYSGQTILFQWIEKIRELLQETVSPSDELILNLELEESVIAQTSEDEREDSVQLPPLTHGEIIEDRKSVFQGHAAAVSCTDQVKQVLQKLYENKKIKNATHNIYAYRIFKDDTKSLIQDCEDDGETHAGGRMLHLLQILDVKNVLVVVSRWYGGIHLGPDRFRHINNAARQVLDKAGFITTSDQKQQHGRKKK